MSEAKPGQIWRKRVDGLYYEVASIEDHGVRVRLLNSKATLTIDAATFAREWSCTSIEATSDSVERVRADLALLLAEPAATYESDRYRQCMRVLELRASLLHVEAITRRSR